MVTPIHEWAPQAEEVTLPSGKVARLKRPDLVAMITGDGDVPDLLSNLILDMTQNNMGARQEVVIDKETLPQIMKSMDVIACACFVEPKVWQKDVAEGEYIPVQWIPFNDKATVMAWALGGQYQAAKTFPPEPNGHLGAVPPGEPVSGKA